MGVGKLTITGSENGLSPGRRQAITWTNAGILLIGISEIWSLNSHIWMTVKLTSANWLHVCLGVNELTAPISVAKHECNVTPVVCFITLGVALTISVRPKWVNTLRPRQDSCYFSCEFILSAWKLLCCDSNVHEISSSWPNENTPACNRFKLGLSA